jgi:WD40 repeat protein
MKMRTILGLALIAVLGMAFASQTAQDYFQQALSKERGEGNLKEAIALYQKAIDTAKDEALAAKAQLQIGLCYEKMGLQEAEKAFKLVIEKYPGQAETVKTAKERLDRLASASHPLASATGMVLRKLDIPIGIISPDGKYVGSTDSDEDLFLFNMATGQRRILRKSSESGFLMTSVLWSPDSKKFVYSWGKDRKSQSLFIWTIGENVPRPINLDRAVAIHNLVGWTPDRDSILIRCSDNDVAFLAWLDMDRGTLDKITEPGEAINELALSPDGKLIALRYKKAQNEYEMRIMTADGRSSSPVPQILSADRLLTWAPEGKQLLFSSNRAGDKAIWLLDVVNGQASGEAKRVSSLGGDVLYCGMTRSGELFYSTFRQANEAYAAKVDVKTGKTLQPPQKVEPETVGRTSTPIWSADGKLLGFFYKKGSAANPNSYDAFKVRDLISGSTKEITLDLSAEVEMMQLPRWSKDGLFVYLLGRKPGENRGLYRLEVSTGRSELVFQSIYLVAWSSDGNTVFLKDYGAAGPVPPMKAQTKLVRKDLRTGDQVVLYDGEVGEMMTWVMVSPDNNLIIFSSALYRERLVHRGLRILPANPEIPISKEQITALNPSSGASVYDWASDGKGLLMGILPPRGDQESGDARVKYQFVYYANFNQNISPVKLDLDLDRCSNITFHPDGQTIAYTRIIHIEEFWALENFLPKK